ncbi:MAG: 16S rRNA (cytosine(1402)-N(4))-methyltransferase [Bacteroidota bacterium]
MNVDTRHHIVQRSSLWVTSATHIPVLLQESLSGLNIQPQSAYVYLTFGGGHARAMLTQLTPSLS